MTRRRPEPAASPFRILSPIHQANRQASLRIDVLLSDLKVSASEGQLLASSLLASIAFHEAYHLGQTGLCRRLLGKPGALLAPGEAGHQQEVV